MPCIEYYWIDKDRLADWVQVQNIQFIYRQKINIDIFCKLINLYFIYWSEFKKNATPCKPLIFVNLGIIKAIKIMYSKSTKNIHGKLSIYKYAKFLKNNMKMMIKTIHYNIM